MKFLIPFFSILMPLTAATPLVYVDQHGDFTPPNPAEGDSVTWKAGTPDEVSDLIFGSTAFISLQSAIDTVDLEGQIRIAAGIYDEGQPIRISKSVSLLGDGGNLEELEARDGFEFDQIEEDFAEEVEALGITIFTGNLNKDEQPGQGRHRLIRIGGKDHIQIKSLAILNGGGVSISNASSTIDSCTFANNSTSQYKRGGGLSIFSHQTSGFSKITNCMFSKNSSEDKGGGICIISFEASHSIEIESCTLKENSANTGGGLHILSYQNSGSLKITNCIITNNFEQGINGDGGGGAYINLRETSNSLELKNCTFTNNSAQDHGGGLRFEPSESPIPLSITDCTFTNNSTGNNGGGMYINSHKRLKTPIVKNCTFTNNFAQSYGGGMNSPSSIKIINCTLTNNSAIREGGGIYTSGKNTQIASSTINKNSALRGGGGGIKSSGGIEIINSVISQNNSTYLGGGLFTKSRTHLDPIKIHNCTFTENHTQEKGGAIYAAPRTNIHITNTTISNNSSDDQAGAIYFHYPWSARLTHTTIAYNKAPRTGGIVARSFSSWREKILTIKNSIIAGNENTNTDTRTLNSELSNGQRSRPEEGSTDYLLSAESGNNIIGWSRFATSPKAILSKTLADNGGPTPTHALVPGSPAINAGNAVFLPIDEFDLDGDGDTSEPVPFDQRGTGFPRVLESAPDLGAVEGGFFQTNSAIATDYLPGEDVRFSLFDLFDTTVEANGPVRLISFSQPINGFIRQEGAYLIFTPLFGNAPAVASFTLSDGVTETTGTFRITPAAPPKAQAVEMTNGVFTLEVAGIPGKRYEIQSSSTMAAESWDDIIIEGQSPQLCPESGVMTFRVPVTDEHLFFRACIMP